jgi:hypothetical protein
LRDSDFDPRSMEFYVSEKGIVFGRHPQLALVDGA